MSELPQTYEKILKETIEDSLTALILTSQLFEGHILKPDDFKQRLHPLQESFIKKYEGVLNGKYEPGELLETEKVKRADFEKVYGILKEGWWEENPQWLDDFLREAQTLYNGSYTTELWLLLLIHPERTSEYVW